MDKVDKLIQILRNCDDPNLLELRRWLEEHGEQINVGVNGGWTAVLEVSKTGRSDALSLLLEHGGDVNMVDIDDWTPLMWSSVRGHDTCVQILLDHGASVTQSDKRHGQHPLYLATTKDQLPCVRILLEVIYSQEQKIRSNKFALCLTKGKRLFSHVNKTEFQHGRTALVAAGINGYLECMKLLIEYGSDVNKICNKGHTALTYASKNGHTECVSYLLEHGAHVNTVVSDSQAYSENGGDSGLMLAAKNGHFDCLEILLQHGATVNLCNELKTGETALMRAAGDDKCVQLLLNHGASVNATNNFGSTALYFAVVAKNKKSISTLLKHGSSINRADTNGMTPLIKACLVQKVECLHVLLCNNADISIKACLNGYEQTAIQVLQRYCGVRVRIREDVLQCVWLMVAAGSEVPEQVKELQHCAYNKNTNNSMRTICRQKIRQHLLQSYTDSNLVFLVPQLPLPPIIKSYLLYDFHLKKSRNTEAND